MMIPSRNGQRRPVCHAQTLLLLLLVSAAVLLLSVDALRTRNGIDGLSMASQQRLLTSRDPASCLVSVPRGGATDSEESTETKAKEVGGGGEEEDDEEGVVDDAAEEEEQEEASAEEEEADAVDEEEEVEVVFPTDEIPSDDVRAFHTTDGELADDEGVYTDGQNESPIAVDNEAEAPADGDDDDDIPEAASDRSSTGVTTTEAVRTAATVIAIDDDLKNVLMTELRYTEDDVSNMRPEIARDVVENKLVRPTEGMPRNWYTDPENPPKPSLLAKRKTLIVSLAAVGVAALSFGVLKENDFVEDTIDDILEALKSIPKSLAAIVTAAKIKLGGSKKKKKKKETPAAAVAATKPATETEEETGTQTIAASSAVSETTSIHSIKPGTTPNEVPDPDIDQTWLDKGLTRVGGLFKALFNAKI